MATLVLSAFGASVGASVGGSVLGLGAAAVGRAAGATLGRVIDQRLMGAGARVVESGQVDRFRVAGAGDGAVLPWVFGQTRVTGQVIWASRFMERVERTTSGGSGKGAPRQPSITTETYRYSVSLALALCEGEITRVGRVWADGEEVSRGSLDMRVYKGTATQQPDPKIAAVEGAANALAYRGTAYVVIEDLDLGPFGNRVPQFSFEVLRGEPADLSVTSDVAREVQGVALIPGTGEYSLATTQVNFRLAPGVYEAANRHDRSARTDFLASDRDMQEELPKVRSVSMVVSWFGDDLRCGSCELKPKVDRDDVDGAEMAWSVTGLSRETAEVVPKVDGRSVFGGTPADLAVIEAIRHYRDTGREVMFYPFILMEVLAGNTLTDPWTGTAGQPPFPWRGRITGALAPGLPGSPDGTAAADAQVAAFFGTASADDFEAFEGGVRYTGPEEWSLRRFILHYAHLCKMAGGVEAFCIGSEMRALTQIRGATGFPAVAGFMALAAEVRAVLGPEVKIGYAADWSEYFGYRPEDGSGDVYFHLDPLWAHPDIDFVGIDNYMPLSDWRDGASHADAAAGSIYDLDYLTGNVAGGEGYAWYYASLADRDAQIRTPIVDTAHGEHWVFRYKDIRGWWENAHHERIGGVRQASPTAWVPGSKPVWFTEYGCAAIDKGANQPNVFLDPKSSESFLPYYSNGARDDLMALQYLRATHSHWAEAAHNPVSAVYGGPMVDMTRAHVWAWDARPYPAFPNLRGVWSDGANYPRGHWMNARSTGRPLASVVAEICERAGVADYDVSRLHGFVRGYHVDRIGSGRAALQPLMLAHGFDAAERDGVLTFRSRGAGPGEVIEADALALVDDNDGVFERTRAAVAESAGRVQLGYVEAGADYDARTAEAVMPEDTAISVSRSEVPLVMTAAEARAVTERWLTEARVAREGARFALPLSRLDLGAGDVVSLAVPGGLPVTARIDTVGQGTARMIEAVQVDPDTYVATDEITPEVAATPYVPPLPMEALFLDLPLLRGDEVEHAPHVAASAVPWPGGMAVYSAAEDAGYRLNRTIRTPSVVGVTETDLAAADPARPDRGPALRVRLGHGALASVTETALANGANLAAVGDGTPGGWELFQFRDAVLVGPDTWELSHRLRGQAGSEVEMVPVRPAGSVFVLLDGAAEQIGLAVSERGLSRHYRTGPVSASVEDPLFQQHVLAFEGRGLRPYAPAHLRVRPSGTDLAVSWVRRTRLDGDGWEAPEVPLGEAVERYLVRVRIDGAIVREVETDAPHWTYTAAMQAADGGGLRQIDVAQISDRVGPGPHAKVILDD